MTGIHEAATEFRLSALEEWINEMEGWIGRRKKEELTVPVDKYLELARKYHEVVEKYCDLLEQPHD